MPFFASFAFVIIHTAISLIAIVAGLAALYGMLNNRRMDGITGWFLVFTVLTSLTGFLFPFHGVTPAVSLGVISSAVLIVALAARYAFAMRGAWRWIYVATAVLALYLNCFVLVVQSFAKIPALHALAPSEPPSGPVFGAAQGVVLIAFVIAGYLAVRRFRPRPLG